MKYKIYEAAQEHWLDMPDFEQTKQEPYAQITIRVNSKEDLDELGKRLEQKFTNKTKSAWFPFKSHWGLERNVWISDES
jgi:hypothetical protein